MGSGNQDRRKLRYLIWLGVAAGTLLAVIGLRFLIVPRTAANNFGLAKELAGYELHLMVGLRDLWLGGLAVVFALLKEWRALMWWFAMGAIVCFADAAIAAYSSGKIANVLFHLVSGAFCAGLAVQLARLRNDG